MREQAFYKMSGAGNDFVVLDNRQGALSGDLNAFSARVADRKRGVGADGVLLLEPSPRKHFRMRYFNADGSEAEMCGNGGRCIARFAALTGAAPATMQFENLAGDFEAAVLADGLVELRMTKPHSLKLDLDLPVDGRLIRGHSLNTGVPHLVVPVADARAVDVAGLGPKLRYHAAFAPKGTNVNFVQVLGPRAVLVRTYERGVEGETLACGTGAVASAVVMARLGLVSSPVAVTTSGGDTLTIIFSLAGDEADSVTLKGQAEVTFEGRLDLDKYL
ncbi:MAG TPA: diaminopimelate epimerase [bacterium]|jgi:diaminopimelate epimerase|nr:diaminopimelate epimerase [bacterium]